MKRYDDKWGIFLFIFYKYMSDIVFFSKMKKKKDFCLVQFDFIVVSEFFLICMLLFLEIYGF